MDYERLVYGSRQYDVAWNALAKRLGGYDKLTGWQYMGHSAKVPGAHAFRLRAGEPGNNTGANMWEHVAL